MCIRDSIDGEAVSGVTTMLMDEGLDTGDMLEKAEIPLDKEAVSYTHLDVYKRQQYSLSDDQTKLGRPEGFELTVRDVYVSAGAGFVVALTGRCV